MLKKWVIKWLSDQVTKWPSDRVTEWPSDWVTEWLSDRVTEWQSDQVTKWQSDQVTKQPSDRKLRRRLTVWYISISTGCPTILYLASCWVVGWLSCLLEFIQMFDCFNGYLLFDRELVSIIYSIHILTSFKLSTFSFISDCKWNLEDQDNWRKWYFYLPGLGQVLVQDSEVRTELNHAIVHNTVTPAHGKYDSIFASNNTFILSSLKVKI